MKLKQQKAQHKNKIRGKSFLSRILARPKHLKNFYKKGIFLLFVLFFLIPVFVIPLFFAKGAGHIDPEVITVSYSPSSPVVNQEVTVTVAVSNILSASPDLEVGFGDGITSATAGCPPSTPTQPTCVRSFQHTYTSVGPRTIKVDFWPNNNGDNGGLTTKTFPIVIGANIGHGAGGSPSNDMNPLNYSTFGELLDSILNVIFYISIIVAPLLIVIGLFLMLSNSATPEKVALGRKIILYSVVILGIIIMIRSMFVYFKWDLTFT